MQLDPATAERELCALFKLTNTDTIKHRSEQICEIIAGRAGKRRSRQSLNQLFKFFIRAFKVNDDLRFMRHRARFDDDRWLRLRVVEVCKDARITPKQYERAIVDLQRAGVVRRELERHLNKRDLFFRTVKFKLVPRVILEIAESLGKSQMLALRVVNDEVSVSKILDIPPQNGGTLSTNSSLAAGPGAPASASGLNDEKTCAAAPQPGFSLSEEQESAPGIQETRQHETRSRDRIVVSEETRQILELLYDRGIFPKKFNPKQVKQIQRATRLSETKRMTPARIQRFILVWNCPGCLPELGEDHWIYRIDQDFFARAWTTVWKTIKKFSHTREREDLGVLHRVTDFKGVAKYLLNCTLQQVLWRRLPFHEYSFLYHPWPAMPCINADEKLLARYLWSLKLEGDHSHFYQLNRANLIAFLDANPHWYQGFKELGAPIDAWVGHHNWVPWLKGHRDLNNRIGHLAALTRVWESDQVVY